MTMKATPHGYHSVTPYLTVNNASAAIEFYQRAFGAKETLRLVDASGKVGHAELRIGDSIVMLSDEHPEIGVVGPETLGGTAGSLLIYVANVDQAFAAAMAAGGTELRPVQDQFYGDRAGKMRDPFGHVWTLATHLEDLTPEEIERRYQESVESQA